MMKQIIWLAVATLLSASCKRNTRPVAARDSVSDSLARINPYVATDQSPMDISWCPDKYPVQTMKGNDSLKLIARVGYSRPHRKKRKIFGAAEPALCIYGKPWRLGANEATEITLFENVNIAGQNINKGMYVLYCIPHADRWTIVFNSNLYSWGLQMNEAKDVFRTDIPVMRQSPALEDFTIFFEETATGSDMIMAWDDVKTVLPLVYLK